MDPLMDSTWYQTWFFQFRKFVEPVYRDVVRIELKIFGQHKTNSPQMSDLNPRCVHRKRTIFSEFLRWTPRSLNAKIRIIKKTNPDYIITRKRVGRDRHGPQFRVFKLIVAIRVWSIGTSLGSGQGSILTFSYFLSEIVEIVFLVTILWFVLLDIGAW